MYIRGIKKDKEGDRKMKKFLKKLWSNEKGFTLVELIIVIAILAVVAAIAVPNIMNSVDDSRKAADKTNAQTIANAVAKTKIEDTYASTTGFFQLEPTAGFVNDVIDNLNGANLTPKFNSNTLEFFYINITSDELIIYAGPDGVADSTVATLKQVYPNPDPSYN